MADIGRWLSHNPMSDPGPHAGLVAALPSGVGALNAIVQGILVHADWVGHYGLDQTTLTPAAWRTLPIRDRLDDVLQRDPRPFHVHRPAEQRATGTCRDFAMLLCAFLRCQGVPARVRCGFAAYFSAGWEDHWVCEHWDAQARTWRLSDPQIDAVLQERNRIAFDPADVPRTAFMLAGEAWLACRRGDADPRAFGHGDVTGLWFVKVNVVRDHYALNGREISSWDRWREVPGQLRSVADADLALLDDLAARPEQSLIDLHA